MRNDALIVGAGPTGLMLAAQMNLLGSRVRIIDRLLDRTRESRALALQPRSLEIFDRLGVAQTFLERGNRSARLQVHFDSRTVLRAALDDIGAVDTRFPFLLFLSQAETEAILTDYLESRGVTIERGVELMTFHCDADGVTSLLRTNDGDERWRSAYVIGCDGAHSTVRRLLDVPFEGGAYPQHFLLADVEVDGPLERDTIHSFPGRGQTLMIFPLGHPRSWRVIGMEPQVGAAELSKNDLSLEELQAFVETASSGQLHPRDPAWLTRFRLHHRQAAKYRLGRAFLAGDAAHIHSPAGAQGMNTGIQDAWNLGWKLAYVTRGLAAAELLDSYQAERWPIGRFLLRYTDRLFSFFMKVTSGSRLATAMRGVVARWILPTAIGFKPLRAFGFRTMSQLAIRYRKSPAVLEGRQKLQGGPRAGDRLPDLPLTCAGKQTSLQQLIDARRFNLFLCGFESPGQPELFEEVQERHGEILAIHRLIRDSKENSETLTRLGVSDAAQILVRPDGHIAFRNGGVDTDELFRYMARWFVPPATAPSPGRSMFAGL